MQRAGQRLLQFELLEPLGQGGMGVVYRALDTHLNRLVALKLLPRELAYDPAHQARLFREARAAALVAHPNVATIYQVDQVESQIFIAMEFVDGQTLEAWLGRGAMNVHQALAIVRDLCAGVGCAHAAGVVHRDLKPANVMIPRSGPLKVLDFGIAKLPRTGEVGRTGTQLMQAVDTQAGQILGTVGYMSPEQAVGGVADARSDVFSIGVILYELLSGRRPFQGDTPAAVMLSTTRDQPVSVSTLNAGAAGPLEQILCECLAKDPAQRPANALVLRQRLEALSQVSAQGATPGAAQSPLHSVAQAQVVAPNTDTAVVGTLPEARRPTSRAALWIGLGAAAVIALLGVGGGALVWFSQSRAAPAPELRKPVVGLNTLKAYENPDDSRTSTLSAPVWATATRDFEQAFKQPGAPKRWAAAAAFTDGERLLDLGRLEEAVKAFKRSQALDESFALPWVGLSATLLRLRQIHAALAAAEKAQLLAPKLWPAVTAAARVYAHDGQLDYAIQEYRRALAMAPNKPFLMSELALTYHAAHLDEEAVRYAEQALELDPDVVPALILLAERALEAEDGATALRHARRATGVEPRDVTAWLARGDALLLLHEDDAARRALGTAVRLWRETRQRGAPDARLKEVQAALDQGRLPAPRTGASGHGAAGEASAVGSSSPRSQPDRRSSPTPRGAPVPRSVPPARSKPAPAPIPRSQPSPQKSPRSLSESDALE